MTENLLTTDIPEKFKDPETGDLQSEKLLKSYLELERRLSSSPSAPSVPEEYEVNVEHGLFDVDQDVNSRLHKCGMSNEQVQEVYNLAAEKLMPMMAEIMSEFEADREVEKLINHFGGTEQWKEVSRQLLAFGQQNMPADVLENLSSSFEGVLSLHRLMQTEEPNLQSRDTSGANEGEELDLQSMMRDPKYWKEKDPAFVAKVTEGFKKMYGG